MEGICSSETSVDTQRTTRRSIPEDGTLQIYTKFYLEKSNARYHLKDLEIDGSTVVIMNSAGGCGLDQSGSQ
jgi:hypothetical protein